ncbi:hypothetical protein AVDCRST_MAG81-1601 [uncultured Synechococcales cyanobacterium]|uniref:Uncharacterized protein n=1 Tax=uncultured Synechococcales cyanobacterium TaxID=1936017 RepID=A0A6J4V868_9CYAN|nr:hypothetical protein AVDCRST_MAG81-1601 [uncultured Synechococcales cyanobacterium]
MYLKLFKINSLLTQDVRLSYLALKTKDFPIKAQQFHQL